MSTSFKKFGGLGYNSKQNITYTSHTAHNNPIIIQKETQPASETINKESTYIKIYDQHQQLIHPSWEHLIGPEGRP